ncbi:MAG: hypothetical protein PWP57_145 [Candidatus Atribacteria bacterium]|nr:hypothetical protein [Candidatus Atribacteria bacterium]
MVKQSIAKLLFLAIPQLLLALFMTIVPALSPLLQKEFSITPAEIGFLTTSIFAGFGISSLLAGKIVDRLSFDKVFFLGHLVLGLFLFLSSLSVSYWQLFLFLFLSGFGDSLITTASAKAVVCWFPEEGRATVSALYKTGFPLGSAIAAVFLPLIALRFSWVGAFRFIGTVFIVWGCLIMKIYQKRAEVQSITVFVNEDKSKKNSLSSFDKQKVYLIGIVGMFFTAIQYCLITYLVIYLVEGQSFSFLRATSLLSIFQLSGIGGRIVLGLSSDFLIKNRNLTLLIAALISWGGILLLILSGSAYLLYLSCILLGFSVVGWVPLWLTIASEAVPSESSGWATGIAMAVQSIGGLIGPPLLGLVIGARKNFDSAFIVLLITASITVAAIGLLKSLSDKEVTMICDEEKGEQSLP